MDIIRVLRLIEYVGPRDAVESQILRSVHGTKVVPSSRGEVKITAVTIGEVAKILSPQEE